MRDPFETSPAVIVAEMLMLRSYADKTIVMVEGGSDVKVLVNFLDSETSDFVISHGREKALSAAAVARERGLRGVLCIVDRDYTMYLNGAPEIEGLVMPDGHDLEVMMLKSQAFDRLLTEIGSAEKLSIERKSNGDLRNCLIEIGMPVGIFRFLSLKKAMGLKFEGIVHSYVDRRTLSFDIKRMIDEVCNNSQDHAIDRSLLAKEIADELEKDHDGWMMCCGHDLIALLGLALKSRWGTNDSSDVRPNRIESLLRVGFGIFEFVRTKLFADILAWEKANVPYKCLRAECSTA